MNTSQIYLSVPFRPVTGKSHKLGWEDVCVDGTLDFDEKQKGTLEFG